MRTVSILSLVAAVILSCAFGCRMGALASSASREEPSSLAPGIACDAASELAGLDPRKPVPLQPRMAWHQKQNMMEHLVAIERITDGLAREDWEEIGSASTLIGSSPQTESMCSQMGAGAEGFTERALDFHRRADAIGDAARAQDGAAVLRATSETLAACTGCHAMYRQEIVDPAEWQRRTGREGESAAGHGGHH